MAWPRKRGEIYGWKGEVNRALAEFDEALRHDPRDAVAYHDRGLAHQLKHAFARAAADYTAAFRLNPQDVASCNELAWLLATCPQDGVRDGQKALDYAQSACKLTRWKYPAYLETLAAAYAESGQFKEAIQWQKKALEDSAYARAQGAGAGLRLQLYERGKPYRQE